MNGLEHIPEVNGVAYSWVQIQTMIAGVPVTGITAINYKDSQEMDEIYGAGRMPVARGYGRIKAEGSITLLQDEIMAIRAASAAPSHRLQDIAPFTINVSYIKEGSNIITDTLHNCQFKTNGVDTKEGDTSIPQQLDLQISHIDWGA
jgi:hypothetical protein